MIYQSNKNRNSHLTVKERTKPSFPTVCLWEKDLIKGNVLDFGCGLGEDVKFLEDKGLEVSGYDPYYFPNYPTDKKFDTIICHYVLNVLLPLEQTHVLMAISELLKPSGVAFYTVRRDVEYNGFRYNPYRDVEVFQCNVKLNFQSILLRKHCEIYQYQHFNQIDHKSTCNLCNPSPDKNLLTESSLSYALLSPSESEDISVIVAPKRHFGDYFQLSFKEQQSCWLLVNRVKKILESNYSAKRFKIELQCGFITEEKPTHTLINIFSPKELTTTKNPPQ